MTDKPLPLAGLRVLDISSLYAAPLVATILGDFGAEVVKIEPPGGDGFRGTGLWPVVARNKKSVTLDLRQPEGCALLRELIRHADVIIDNYPAKVLEKRGIAWKDLSAINPKLVMLSVSCYGQQGPYGDRPGSGTIGEGFGGLTRLTGQADSPPLLPSLALGDGIAATNMALGAMMALYWRDARGGAGQHIDASLFEPILNVLGNAIARWKPGQSPQRCGSRLPGSAIRNVYATRDGQHVVISASTPRHVDDLVALAGGQPGEDADTVAARWIRTQPLAELRDLLASKRIPVAAVNDLDMLLADPHVQARGSLTRQHDPELGDVALAAPAPRLSASPGSIRWINPGLGAHNDEVFGSLLGYDAPRIAKLRHDGLI